MPKKKKSLKFQHAVPVTSGLENPILRAVSKPVEKITDEILELLKVMHDTMEKEQGIGIAAPQVGVNLRIALVKLNPNTEKEKIITVMNPEISERSMRTISDQEGCLSLRGKWGKVPRSESLTLEFHDEHWKTHRLALEDLNARIVQHEVDHLDGVLFWDRVAEKDRLENE